MKTCRTLLLTLIIPLLLPVDSDASSNRSVTINASREAPGVLSLSLANETHAAIARGVAWLVSEQQPDGSWAPSSSPAVTALALQALASSNSDVAPGVLRRGTEFLISRLQSDGSVSPTNHHRVPMWECTYTSAMTLLTLRQLPALSTPDTIHALEGFVSRAQYTGSGRYSGAFGATGKYDNLYCVLQATLFSCKALSVRAADKGEHSEPFYTEQQSDAAAAFLRRTLKSSLAVRKDDTVSARLASKMPNPGKERRPVAPIQLCASEVYAASLGLLYTAESAATDPVLTNALHHVQGAWDLSRNPGLGKRHLYFYYWALAACLDKAERDIIHVGNETILDWKPALARKLLEIQRTDPATGKGYWINSSRAYGEDNPALTTSYALLTLRLLLR